MTLFSRLAAAVSAVIWCSMSLGDVVDLVILTFEELRGLARRHSIDGLDSMARAEVVGKLREADVGVLHPSAAGVVERLGEMMRIVVSISDELAALRDDRGWEITPAEENGIPLSEVEAIVKRELASLSDRVGDLERASGGKQHKHARQQMTAPLASYSKIERAQRDLHATSRGEGSVLEDVARNEPKELYSQAISRDTAPIDLPMDISVDQAPFEDVMSRKERRRFKRRLASEPSGTEKSIAEWCRDRYVEIVQCIINSSEYFRTASARITVDAQDVNKVSEKSFWPETVAYTLRDWRFRSDQAEAQ